MTLQQTEPNSPLALFDVERIVREDSDLEVLHDYGKSVIDMYNSNDLYALARNSDQEPIINSFKRFTAAGAGANVWQCRNYETDSVSSLKGIVIQIAPTRIFFEKELPPGGTGTVSEASLPICTSIDMKHGIGTPGMECARCPLRDFKLNPHCNTRNWLFLVSPDERYPVRLDLTGPVAQGMKTYTNDQVPKGYAIEEVVSKMGLVNHPKYNQPTKATSLITGVTEGLTYDQATKEEFMRSLAWLKMFLSSACLQWAEWNKENAAPSPQFLQSLEILRSGNTIDPSLIVDGELIDDDDEFGDIPTDNDMDDLEENLPPE